MLSGLWDGVAVGGDVAADIGDDVGDGVIVDDGTNEIASDGEREDFSAVWSVFM